MNLCISASKFHCYTLTIKYLTVVQSYIMNVQFLCMISYSRYCVYFFVHVYFYTQKKITKQIWHVYKANFKTVFILQAIHTISIISKKYKSTNIRKMSFNGIYVANYKLFLIVYTTYIVQVHFFLLLAIKSWVHFINILLNASILIVKTMSNI